MSTVVDSAAIDESYHRRVMADLNLSMDETQSVGFLGLADVELEEFTVAAVRFAERANALAAKAVAEADSAQLARRSGFKSLNAHLAAKLHSPTATLAPRRTIGLWISRFSEVEAAYLRGAITKAHVRELKMLDNPRTHLLLVRDQNVLLTAADDLEFSDWQKALSYWLLHADPDGALSKDRADPYGMSIRTHRNGDVEITMKLDPITGEAFMTAVEHEAQKLFRNEKKSGHPEGVMPHRKRRSIALMRLIKRGFARKDGSYPVPLVNIVMSETVAEDLLARMFGEAGTDYDPHQLPLKWDDIDMRCETIRGTPIHPRRAWPAVLIGRLRRQVLGADSRTIDLGHDVRLFNAVQKNALLVESRGQCMNEGCDAPFAWLEADHEIAYIHGGLTNLDEGKMRCKPDNQRKGSQ